jgi:glycosyltransferase involved in cell wall biosynthesis
MTSPIRIGIEAQRIFRSNKHGMDVVAVETIRHMVRMIEEHDLPVQLVVFVRDGPDRCLPSSPHLAVRPVAGQSYPTWEHAALPNAVRTSGVDLLHCTSNTAPLNVSVPLVVTLHDVIFMEAPLGLRGGTPYQMLGNAYRRFSMPHVVQQARAICTVSRYEASRITSVFPSAAERLHVVPNGIRASFSPPEDASLIRDGYNLPSRYLFLLGNTAPKKNFAGALRAYGTYADQAQDPLPLVVADLSTERLHVRLQQCDRPDLAAHIHTTGYIPHADLPAVYAGASLFLYPSLRESFGLPILEAMSCGTPVITSDRAAMPEVAGTGALLVDPTSPRDIALAVQRVLNNHRLRRALVERGYDRVHAYGWMQTARRLLDVYQDVLGTEAFASIPSLAASCGTPSN